MPRRTMSKQELWKSLRENGEVLNEVKPETKKADFSAFSIM